MMFGLINIDTYKLYETPNEADIEERSRKERIDAYTRAEILLEQEKDPIKYRIMKNRLAIGITDFSDI